MIHLVPRLFPDELLSSGLVRSTRHAHLPITTVTEYLTGREKWRPSFFQVGCLKTLSDVFGLTSMEVLNRHSIFPYATAFYLPDVLATSVKNALSTGKAATGIGSTVQNASDYVPFRQYCPKCALADVQQWAESYWHRAHNLPGALVCTTHNCALHRSDIRTSGRKSWSYALPHEVNGKCVISGRPTHFDELLAKHSVAMLHRKTGIATNDLPTQYREALFRKGLVSRHRQISAYKLSEWCRKLIGANPTRYGLSESEAEMNWLPLMVRPASGVPFMPLKHALFQVALEIQPRVEKPIMDYISTGNISHISVETDKMYAHDVHLVSSIYLKAGDSIRVKDALALAGCWSAFRHNRSAFPKTQKAVLELRHSIASARRINVDFKNQKVEGN